MLSVMEKNVKKQPDKIPFYEGGDWYYNAILSWGEPTWYAHSQGFYRAAQCLSKNMLERGCSSIPLDSGVFPLVFLYRHYLELELKSQLWKMYDVRRFYGQKWNRKKLDELLKGHALSPLFSKFERELYMLWDKTLEEAIQQRFRKETLSDMNHIRKVCMDLDELDKKSLGCRYPINNEGQSYYTDKEKVNIALFVESMQKVYSFLCGANAELDIAVEWIRQ